MEDDDSQMQPPAESCSLGSPRELQRTTMMTTPNDDMDVHSPTAATTTTTTKTTVSGQAEASLPSLGGYAKPRRRRTKTATKRAPPKDDTTAVNAKETQNDDTALPLQDSTATTNDAGAIGGENSDNTSGSGSSSSSGGDGDAGLGDIVGLDGVESGGGAAASCITSRTAGGTSVRSAKSSEDMSSSKKQQNGGGGKNTKSGKKAEWHVYFAYLNDDKREKLMQLPQLPKSILVERERSLSARNRQARASAVKLSRASRKATGGSRQQHHQPTTDSSLNNSNNNSGNGNSDNSGGDDDDLHHSDIDDNGSRRVRQGKSSDELSERTEAAARSSLLLTRRGVKSTKTGGRKQVHVVSFESEQRVAVSRNAAGVAESIVNDYSSKRLTTTPMTTPTTTAAATTKAVVPVARFHTAYHPHAANAKEYAMSKADEHRPGQYQLEESPMYKNLLRSMRANLNYYNRMREFQNRLRSFNDDSVGPSIVRHLKHRTIDEYFAPATASNNQFY